MILLGNNPAPMEQGGSCSAIKVSSSGLSEACLIVVPSQPAIDTTVLSAKRILESLSIPQQLPPNWTRDNLTQFIQHTRQWLSFNREFPRDPKTSLINNAVRSAVLELATTIYPKQNWVYVNLTDEARKNRSSGQAIGQIPRSTNNCLVSLSRRTYIVGVAKLESMLAGESATSKRAILRVPFSVEMKGEFLGTEKLEPSQRYLPKILQRGPASWKLQAPIDSEVGRWSALLQSKDGITPYTRCGQINDGFNFPIGVPTAVVAEILEREGFTHALLPPSRRDPAFLPDQEGRYLSVNNGSLFFSGEVLNRLGEPVRAHIRVDLSVKVEADSLKYSEKSN